LPAGHHPFADTISEAELVQMIARVRGRIAHQVGRQPPHADFIAACCAAESA